MKKDKKKDKPANKTPEREQLGPSKGLVKRQETW